MFGRLCSYPQHITLQLVERSRVRKLQLLAHQYLIPAKVEFHIGDTLPETSTTGFPGQLRRLGWDCGLSLFTCTNTNIVLFLLKGSNDEFCLLAVFFPGRDSLKSCGWCCQALLLDESAAMFLCFAYVSSRVELRCSTLLLPQVRLLVGQWEDRLQSSGAEVRSCRCHWNLPENNLS